MAGCINLLSLNIALKQPFSLSFPSDKLADFEDEVQVQGQCMVLLVLLTWTLSLLAPKGVGFLEIKTPEEAVQLWACGAKKAFFHQCCP